MKFATRVLVSTLAFGGCAFAAYADGKDNKGAGSNAGSPETVTIEITVQEFTSLAVENSAGSMIVDDDQERTMGSTSSGAGTEAYSAGNYATVRLNTNYTLDKLSVSFPQIDGIRDIATDPFGYTTYADTYFGQATNDSGATLGVVPNVFVVNDGGTTATTDDTLCTNTTNTRNVDTENDPLIVEPGAAGACGGLADFEPDTHLLALGVSTAWSNTILTEPVFAAADTYSIDLEVTIVP